MSTPTKKHLKNETGQAVGRVTLHSVNAQQLWIGREDAEGRRVILSCGTFVRRSRNMESAAEFDPWAKQSYQKILDALEKSREYFHQKDLAFNELMSVDTDAITHIEPDLSDILRPKQFDIEFSSRAAWEMAELVVLADQLIIRAMKAERLALYTKRERSDSVRDTQRQVRFVISLLKIWKYTGVTYEDVKNNTPLAQEAIELFGPLEAAGNKDQAEQAGNGTTTEVEPCEGLFARLRKAFKKN